jgi:hypothetical protein
MESWPVFNGDGRRRPRGGPNCGNLGVRLRGGGAGFQTLEALGCLPDENPVSPACLDAAVVNKRAVLSHLRNSLVGRCNEFDYPHHGRIADALHSLYELFFLRDSLFSMADLRGTLWSYRPKNSIRRWRQAPDRR